MLLSLSFATISVSPQPSFPSVHHHIITITIITFTPSPPSQSWKQPLPSSSRHTSPFLSTLFITIHLNWMPIPSIIIAIRHFLGRRKRPTRTRRADQVSVHAAQTIVIANATGLSLSLSPPPPPPHTHPTSTHAPINDRPGSSKGLTAVEALNELAAGWKGDKILGVHAEELLIARRET